MEKRLQKKSYWYKQYHPWLFLLPTIFGLMFFRIGPILSTFFFAFTRWDLLAPLRWLKLDNFLELLQSKLSLLILQNTLLFSLLYTVGVAVTGLALALLLNQKHRKGKYFFRTAIYIPVVTSAVAVGIVWFWILSPQYGLLEILIRSLGIQSELPIWLGDKQWSLLTVTFIQIWKMCGYYMILYLSGLQYIPQTILEASRIDGANPWQRFFLITLPLLSSTTFFVLIIATIDSFKNFEMIYTLTRGGPNNASNTISYDIYVNAFIHHRLGYASAEAVLLLFVIALITYLNFSFKNRWVNYFD